LFLLSPSRRTQKLTPVHSILERLASVDENYGRVIVVLLGFDINIHLAPLEVGIALELRKRLLDDAAKMTSFARIDRHVVHSAILNACPAIPRR
jgi:hypothetical protein